MGAFLGILSALSIGSSELFARRLMERTSALTTGVVIGFFALVASVASLLPVDSELIWADLGRGTASGFGMGIGIIGYLVGLRRASSAVIAPYAATLSAVIPFGYTIVRGDAATPIALAGAMLAFLGLVFITAGQGSERGGSGAWWGVLAGVAYGFALAVVIDTSEASGAWPAVGQRLTGLLFVVLVAWRRGEVLTAPPGSRAVAVASGVLGGLASVLYLVGVRIDAAGAVVASSMFPAVTVAVGYLYFSDAVTRRQVVGLLLALAGIVAVVAG